LQLPLLPAINVSAAGNNALHYSCFYFRKKAAMNDLSAIIERVRRVSANVVRLDVAVEIPQRNIQAGQHFLARLTESWDPYLREPWIPIKAQRSNITIERPTALNVQPYQPGQVVHLLGPVGQPIPLIETARTLLLIAYDATPASLLMLADIAIQRRLGVALALIGSARGYPLEALPPEIEIVRGNDDGSWPEQTVSLVWADQVVAVAPPHDRSHYARLLETITQVRVEAASGYVSGLFQPSLPCGVGACGACAIACQRREVLACVDGPALDLLNVTLR
jgi:dihydroorotate dehydrogenase electron transfer subunit